MNVPSGYTALDLIGFTDKGDYDSTANYVENDLVHDSGRVWLCLIDDTKNVTPAVGANWKIWIDEAAYLSGLADTTITNPANGQVLRYDSTTSKWVNAGVDSTPTQSSDNLVQSGGVYTQLANKANTADLATVATTGAYSDLSGAPSLAAVATSGAYSDLSGTPTIPTVNDATLTIQKNGTNVETFTANSNTNKTANITVPDVINDLSDVNISSVANEDILAYDSTSSKWKNSGALGNVKQALSNEVTTRSYLGAKNLLKNIASTETLNGVTFTVYDDGTVKVNGTASAHTEKKVSEKLGSFLTDGQQYILNGCPANGSDSTYKLYDGILNDNWNDYGDGVTVTYSSSLANKSIYIRIANGATVSNLTFKPMIRLATDADTTYRPYAPTNSQLLSYKDNGVLGAKNLLPITMVTGVNANITLTVADNKITAVGTATGTDGCIALIAKVTLPKGDYILTGGINTNAKLLLAKTGEPNKQDLGDGVKFTSDGGEYSVYVYIPNTGTAVNVVYYPMIRLASDTDPAYQPYAMTNKELTQIVSQVVSDVFPTALKMVRVGTGQQYLDLNDVPLFSYSYTYGGTLHIPTSEVAVQFHVVTIGLQVSSKSYAFQFAVDNNSSVSNAYIRNCYNNTWSEWNQIAYTT